MRLGEQPLAAPYETREAMIHELNRAVVTDEDRNTMRKSISRLTTMKVKEAIAQRNPAPPQEPAPEIDNLSTQLDDKLGIT